MAFEERALDAGLGFNHVQLLGRPWAVMGTGGVAADFNNDGWTDLYTIGGGDTFDALFINQGIGQGGRVQFENQAAAWGVRTRHYGYGASAADYDLDGDLDLFVTSFGDPAETNRIGQHKLYRNDLQPDGSRVFTDVAKQAGVNRLLPGIVDGLSSCWGDPDQDGDLDLFVTGYDINVAANRMFRNNGEGTFTDVTVAWGLDVVGCSGLAPSFVDLYGNGRADLIVIGDTGTSEIFINRGLDENGVPDFVNRTTFFQGVETANGMGSAVGDLDGDGRLDMYVSSIYFDTIGGPGNVLLMQNADRSFTNIAAQVGVDQGYWCWGVLMVDWDHDRDLDIAEVNGWPGSYTGKPPKLYEQTAPMQFTDVAAESGLGKPGEGRGLVNADFDNDGDQDAVSFNVGGWLHYYENTLLMPQQPVPADANWLRIELDTSGRERLAPQGIHATVRVFAGGVEQMLSIDGGFSECSQGEVGAHAGLGDATTVDWVRVSWPDGSKTTIENVSANQILEVRAPAFAADLNDDGVLDLGDIYTLIERFMAGSLTADINGNGILDQPDLIKFVSQFLTRL
ncbi:MAG: hypothetical protein ACI89L_000939 [Phycisphaerales bacterium]|jgi:hypothetical protein